MAQIYFNLNLQNEAIEINLNVTDIYCAIKNYCIYLLLLIYTFILTANTYQLYPNSNQKQSIVYLKAIKEIIIGYMVLRYSDVPKYINPIRCAYSERFKVQLSRKSSFLEPEYNIYPKVNIYDSFTLPTISTITSFTTKTTRLARLSWLACLTSITTAASKTATATIATTTPKTAATTTTWLTRLAAKSTGTALTTIATTLSAKATTLTAKATTLTTTEAATLTASKSSTLTTTLSPITATRSSTTST
ncbi:hypothetical protein FF38_01639 [Lucilia cuprina]|uniref:Uncharacterized protein n=1 Tax=Lucilia cuprina TaxID=7375 RepID=A0A0L0BZC1_LUCCU|nr:hypothetical protein FF38_01639 [Lucilia cuprina]